MMMSVDDEGDDAVIVEGDVDVGDDCDWWWSRL